MTLERTQELISVVVHGEYQVVQDVLGREKRLGCVADEEGSTLLMYAAVNGRDNVIRYLLQVGSF